VEADLMNDDELDRRLASVREHTEHSGAHDALAALGHTIRAESTPAPRRSRWYWGIGLATAAIALTAGTTATAYYLGVPPFQSLPDGASRAAESIPLNYDTTNGIEIRCRIFLEFENVDAAGVAAVGEAIRDTDWSDFGHDLYIAQGDLPDAPSDVLNPQDEINDAAVDATYAFAASVIPGLRFLGDGAENDPRLSAIATTCRPDAQ
jgi:hypothetical protein